MAGKSVALVYEVAMNDKASANVAKLTGKFQDQERVLKGLRTAGTVQFAALAAGVALYAKASVQAYAESERAQSELSYAVQKFPRLMGTNIDALQAYNTTLMNKVAVDDDAIASTQALLAQFELTEKQLKVLTPLAIDYAKKTGKDLTTSAEVLGKAIEGQGRALKAIGIQFKDTGTQAGNFDQLVAGLSKQVGGFAENQAQTAIGKSEMLKVRWEELQETVGEKLLPALLELAEAGNDALTWIDENQGAATALVITVGTLSTVIAVAANWTKIQATATALSTAAEWAYNAVASKNVTLKAADAAATAASKVAITNLTAATAANTAVTTANTAATKTHAGALKSLAGIAGVATAVFGTMDFARQKGIESARAESVTYNQVALEMSKVTAGAKSIDQALTDLGQFDTGTSLFEQWSGGQKTVDSLSDALEALQFNSKSLASQMGELYSNGDFFGHNDVNQARDAFKALDEALAGMVTSGSVDQAKAALAGLPIAASDAMEYLPGYTDALAGVENQAVLTADATDEVTDSTLDYIDALKEQLDLQREASGVALDEHAARRQLEQAIDDATASLTENGATLDVTTEQGRKNQDALDNLAKSTWDWVDAGAAAGVSSLELKSRMDSGRDSFILAAEQLGLTKTQAKALADQMGLVPGKVDTAVGVSGYDDAMTKFANLRYAADFLVAKKAPASIKATGGGLAPVARAGGGPVYGPGTTTSDSILAALSNEEFVMNAAAHRWAGTDAMWALNNRDLSGFLAAIGTPRLAGGGTPSMSPSYAGASPSLGGAAVAAPTTHVFEIYDVNGVLLGAMRGVARDESQLVDMVRSASTRRS